MKEPLVSVIITTKNEEKNISNCLKSIRNQTYDNLEIIVVDNNSLDNTIKISKTFTNKVFNKGPERSAQRNFGVSKSAGEWIIYLDADMILSPDVIKDCVNTVCKDKDIAGLYISERIVSRNVGDFSIPIARYQDSYWIKVRNFERSFYDGTVIDCVRFVSRDVFMRVKGFDLNLTGPEDWDFDKKVRMEGKAKLVKSIIYHNEGKFDRKRYLEKKKFYSKSMPQYIRKWGRNDRDIRKQLGAAYRLVGVFVERGGIKKVIGNLLLFIGMLYLRLNIAVHYYSSNRGQIYRRQIRL